MDMPSRARRPATAAAWAWKKLFTKTVGNTVDNILTAGASQAACWCEVKLIKKTSIFINYYSFHIVTALFDDSARESDPNVQLQMAAVAPNLGAVDSLNVGDAGSRLQRVAHAL